MKKIRNLILLAILLVQATPCVAQTPIFHGTTLDQVQNVVSGIRNIGSTLNQAGLGLNFAFDKSVADKLAALRASQNALAGMTGPATVPFTLEGVLTEGATVGEFFIDQSRNFSDLSAQIIGNDVSFSEDVQNALYKFDVLKVVGTSSDATKVFGVAHESANEFIAWSNAASADLSIVPSDRKSVV